MKKLYLIGNLKMNLTKTELETFFDKLVAKQYKNIAGLCVPSVYLNTAYDLLKNSCIKYGAQNVHYEKNGAFTGEISTTMLKDFAPNWVLVGHSERRAMFYESDEVVNKKLKAILQAGFTPILCFGETLEERKSGQEKKIVHDQLLSALKDIPNQLIEKIIFAYEPIWAIGTGMTASSEQAEEIIKYAKKVVAGLSSSDAIMLYGGSLNANNANEILQKPSIDGGLIGGASLNFKDFDAIIQIADSITN